MIHFTIITCTYNAESVLQRTLDSIQRQTWKNLSHIIIDGKSSDRTVDIAEMHKSIMAQNSGREDTVLIVSEPDKGLYDAMNKGLALAKPDYVLFLNAGDTFHKDNTLQDIAASINEKSLPGVIYGDTNVVDATNRFMGKREHQPPEELTWKSFSDGMLVCHQAFYVRTDIARQIAYNLKYSLSGDFDWCIRIMKKVEQEHLELLNTNMVVCNFLAGGLSIKRHKQSLHERFVIMVKNYGLFTTIAKHIKFTIKHLR